jgi:hypothetical protein
MIKRLLPAACLAVLVAQPAPLPPCDAADWPRFRGPNGQGIAVDNTAYVFPHGLSKPCGTSRNHRR